MIFTALFTVFCTVCGFFIGRGYQNSEDCEKIKKYQNDFDKMIADLSEEEAEKRRKVITQSEDLIYSTAVGHMVKIIKK
jgi:hypothetical protein